VPSHPDRIRQNYCEHRWPHMDIALFLDYPDLPDGRKCIKCGIDWNKAHPEVIIISGPITADSSWIRDRFVKP